MMVCQLNFIMSFGHRSVKWWSKALMRLMKREKCLTHKGKVSLHLSKKKKKQVKTEPVLEIGLFFLTNVDTKIASKVITTRIPKILSEIIHSNRTGYVSGRYIGEAARLILDVMEHTKAMNITGIL